MLHNRVFQFGLRLGIAAFLIVLLIYGGLRVYMLNLGHTSTSLLEEAARIHIGASEDSILPLVVRYRGVKWTPPPPGPVDDCVDKAACEYQDAHLPDYQYRIALSPFKVISSPKSQVGHVRHFLSVLMVRVPSEWRDPYSLRDWLVDVEIGVRARRVVSVSGYLYVEGRHRWLGNEWSLSAELPDVDMRPKAYVVSGTFLTFPGHGGAGTVHYLTPVATPEQFKSAQSFQANCVTGLIPCRCLSDLTPLAFQYIGHHPDVGSSVEADDCPYRVNPQ